MKKSIIRILIFLTLSFVILQTIVAFPQIFIKKQFSYQCFDLYANEKVELNNKIKSTLDSVQNIIKKSALHSDEIKYQLFLAKGTFYEKLNDFLPQTSGAFAYAFWNREIFLADIDFDSGIFHRNNNEREVRYIVQLIAHESIHVQQSHAGIKRSSPPWLNEGYAEYVTYAPLRAAGEYNFLDAVKTLQDNPDTEWFRSEYGYWDVRDYKYYRVLIEYLIEVKGMTMEEILEQKKTLFAEEIWSEIIN